VASGEQFNCGWQLLLLLLLLLCGVTGTAEQAQ
jgi:hypothetical protein